MPFSIERGYVVRQVWQTYHTVVPVMQEAQQVEAQATDFFAGTKIGAGLLAATRRNCPKMLPHFESANPKKVDSGAEPLCPRMQGLRGNKRDFFQERRSSGTGLLSPGKAACALSGKGAVAVKAKPYFSIKIRRAKRLAATWSCLADSNRRPLPYQGSALPTELRQHKPNCTLVYRKRKTGFSVQHSSSCTLYQKSKATASSHDQTEYKPAAITVTLPAYPTIIHVKYTHVNIFFCNQRANRRLHAHSRLFLL